MTVLCASDYIIWQAKKIIDTLWADIHITCICISALSFTFSTRSLSNKLHMQQRQLINYQL